MTNHSHPPFADLHYTRPSREGEVVLDQAKEMIVSTIFIQRISILIK